MGQKLLETAWTTLNTGDWKLEKKLDNGDMVQVSGVITVFEQLGQNSGFQYLYSLNLTIAGAHSGQEEGVQADRVCEHGAQAPARGALLQDGAAACLESHPD